MVVASEALTPAREWELWAGSVFKTYVAAPNTWLASTFKTESPEGKLIYAAMRAADREFERQLFHKLAAEKVPGSIVEFGTSTGDWVNRAWELSREAGLDVPIYGFDSFEGLPEPTVDDPQGVWKKGDYAEALDVVRRYVRADERKAIHLIKGWFCDSVQTPEAQAIGEIAWARIDGDLYASAVDGLNFITPRLANGAVLYFDEFTFDPATGETKAFIEWVQRTEGKFRHEFLGLNATNHMWSRVWHI